MVPWPLAFSRVAGLIKSGLLFLVALVIAQAGKSKQAKTNEIKRMVLPSFYKKDCNNILLHHR